LKNPDKNGENESKSLEECEKTLKEYEETLEKYKKKLDDYKKKDECLVKLAKIIGSILIIVGLLISIYIVLKAPTSPLIGVGLIGLITFTTVLFGTYLITKEWEFGCGEFRKAITISVIAVFFATLAFGNSIQLNSNTILGQVFTNFWAIVTVVVAFYFGSRVIDNKTNPNNNTSINKGDKGS
jgi:F0F1-type ATP synthase assembly protein I